MDSLPIVGAALTVDMLSDYADWLIADQRDLELPDIVEMDVLDGDWTGMIADIKAMLDGYTGRLGIHGPFRSLPMDAVDPKIRTVVQDRLKQGLDFANQIGATHMVVHSPFVVLGHYKPGKLDSVLEHARATLEPIVPIAEQAGCTLVIETIFDYDPTTLVNFVRSFESDFVKMSIDAGHAFIMHTTLQAPPPDYFVYTAGADLGHVHLADNDGYTDRHWVPGRGKINWAELFDAIATLDHKPRLIIEVHTSKYTNGIHQTIAYLEQLGVAR